MKTYLTVFYMYIKDYIKSQVKETSTHLGIVIILSLFFHFPIIAVICAGYLIITPDTSI